MRDVALTSETWDKLAKASRALAELNGATSSLPSIGLGVLTYPMMAREAETSSRIEGTRSTLEDILLQEIRNKEAHSEREAVDLREVQNYLASAQLAFKLLEDFPLCWRIIRQVHRQLLAGVRGQSRAPGEFRRIQVWIGGKTIEEASYVPPPPDYLPELTRELEAYLNEDNGLDPLIKCGIAHSQFEMIHPFMDGNGRVGRLIISMYLKQKELLNQPVLVLSEYFERYRDGYYNALLSVCATGSWEKWLRYFLSAVQSQAELRLRLTKEQITLYWSYKERIRELAKHKRGVKSANVEPALDLLFQHVFVNAALMRRALGVDDTTGRRLIDELLKVGAIVETTGRRRNREYCCVELLRLLKG